MTTQRDDCTSWIDNQGDVWTLGSDGLMHTPETAAFPREYVEKKWGPLRPLTGDGTPERDPYATPAVSAANSGFLDTLAEPALIAAGHTRLHGHRAVQLRAAIDAVYPAIRQQVAEEIAAAIGVRQQAAGRAVAYEALALAARIAREIGRQA